MTPNLSQPPCETWLWVELTGFDNTQPDFGVADYLDRCGFTPNAVSFLLFNPDFIHTHDGLAEDLPLPFDVASYGGHPYGEDRARQNWTTHQLKGLVDELTRHGVPVWFAVFDQFVTDEWIGNHPELWYVVATGERARCICLFKRLDDGTWYQDFLAAQLARVLTDYGFAGFHQADGISHPRMPLHMGDYSDDVTGQFIASGHARLPDRLAKPCGDQPGLIAERAAWIWRHQRREWIAFSAQRMTAFATPSPAPSTPPASRSSSTRPSAASPLRPSTASAWTTRRSPASALTA